MVRGLSRRGRIALAVVALMLGIALVAYPYVSDYVHKVHQIQVVKDQQAAVDNTSSEALRREMEASLDYNRRLLANRAVVTDPFDPANKPVSSAEYNERCNIAGDGVMGTLVIPKLDVTVPIYHGTADDVLQKGAGHMEATSLPVGGESSHAVFAGHNGLPSVRIFDDLHKLQPGDYFVVRVLGEDHAYRVTSVETVLPDETDSLAIQEGKDLVTLITCTPYGVNTHRLLVHAERCEVPAEWYAHDEADSGSNVPASSEAILPLTLAGLALAAGIVGARLLRGRLGARRGDVAVRVREAEALRGAGGVAGIPEGDAAGSPTHVVSGDAGRGAARGTHARPDGEAATKSSTAVGMLSPTEGLRRRRSSHLGPHRKGGRRG